MADATIVVGDVRAVEVSGREFPVPAGSSVQLDTGRVENTVDTTGSGASIITQVTKPWSATVPVRISEDRGDLGFLAQAFNALVNLSSVTSGFAIPAPPSGPDRQFLGEVIAQGKFVPCTFTLADASVYQGRGTIVGPISADLRTGVATITLAGDGPLTKQ